ncbi:MAG: leucine-rich repeat domain-containing protein [Prevotella sp.]|nr:leucine-rich repeat domain-containing protein [Prevotella sp.]
MKQKHLHIIAVLVALLLPATISAEALKVNDTFEVDGISYTVTSTSPKQVQVKSKERLVPAVSKTTEGTINIPSTVKGTDGSSYSVTAIGEYAFYFCEKLKLVKMPNTVKSIGDDAFTYCAALESIELPSGLTSIGNYAFMQCFKVKTITIPNTVNSIGSGAFRWSGLKEIVLKNKTPLAIDREVFRNWTDREVENGSWPAFIYERTILRVPKGTVNTYKRAEVWKDFVAIVEADKEILKPGDQFTVDKLAYEVIDESNWPLAVGVAQSDSYKSLTGALEIPATVKGTDGLDYKVCEIKTRAFRGCKGITSVTFPNTMSRIRGFDECNGLTSVTIPTGVKYIEGQAFSGCTGLASVTIPNSVISISFQAFSGCQALTSLYIPESVTSIANSAFNSCGGLNSIIVDGNNKVYDSRNGCNAIIKTATNELIRGCNTTVIPDEITIIGEGAFSWCTQLKTITIPDGVTEIGDEAFYNCESLTSINIPSSVTKIGRENYPSAFEHCGSLVSITVESGNPVYDSHNNCNALMVTATNQLVRGCKNTVIPDGTTEIYHYAFSKCKELKNIDIPNTVISIGYGAFQNCEALSSLVVPNSVTEINEQAFANCYKLTVVTLGQSVKKIGARAFVNTFDLVEVYALMEEPIVISNSVFGAPENITLYVPAGTKAKYEATDCWKEFKNIVEMEPESKELAVGDTFEADGITYAVTSLNPREVRVGNGDYQAIDTETTGEIIIPSSVIGTDGNDYSVTEIGVGAFLDCAKLTSIVIPNSLIRIMMFAFDNCYKLKAINIPNSVTYIGGDAFGACHSLTSLSIPRSVSIIEGYAFEKCVGLTSITIPNSVSRIGSGVFAGCIQLKEVHSFIKEPFVIESNVFNNIPDDAILYIPTGTKALYEATDGWKELNNIIEMGPESEWEEYGIFTFNGIDYYVEDGKASVHLVPQDIAGKVIIPSSVTAPNGYAYPVTAVGDRAFMSCNKITEIELPNSITRIGLGAFAFCKFTSITIPNSTIEIGIEAFTSSALNSVTIPNSVTTIGIYAFACGKLKTIECYIQKPFAIAKETFNKYDEATLYVPAGTKALYEATDGWKEFKKIVEFEEAPVYKDGDTFTAKTVEDIELRYTVLDATEKTCMLGVKETIEGEYYPQAFADGSAGKGTGMAYQANMFITIPSEVNGYTVKEIGNHALAASTLSGVSIPSSVDVIHDMAFYSTKISKLVIPASVKSIGNQVAVSNMLKQIIVEEGNPVYDSRNNCNAIIETATNMLILGCEETTIVEGIKIIASGALMGSGTSYGMKEIYIPKSVTTIVDNPFWYGRRIEKIVVADDNPVYDSRNNCNAIINTSTGELVTGCKKTIIPNGVKRIGKYAFSGLNTDLQIIDFPSTIVSIGVGAFTGTLLKEIILPKKLQTIETAAFRNNSVIEKIKIPASVTSIGERVFDVNQSLTEVTSMIKKPFPLNPNAFQSLEYYAEQVTLYVPAGTKALYEATDGWKEFKNIVEMEPEKPYEAKDDGTAIVKNLEPDENGQLVIPEKVEIDGKEYPVTEIAPEAFMDNKDLVEVTIPGTVTTIGADAFAGCGNLRAIYLMSTTPIALSQAAVRGVIRRADGTTVSQFDGVDYETCVLYVPYGCGEAYRNAEGWKLFKHIVEMEDTGINGAALNDKKQMINDKWYDLKGRRISQPKKGVNILRDSSGKTRKVVIK